MIKIGAVEYFCLSKIALTSEIGVGRDFYSKKDVRGRGKGRRNAKVVIKGGRVDEAVRIPKTPYLR